MQVMKSLASQQDRNGHGDKLDRSIVVYAPIKMRFTCYGQKYESQASGYLRKTVLGLYTGQLECV